MLWVTLIIGQLLAFVLVGTWMLHRHRQFVWEHMPQATVEEEEEAEESYSLVQQMMMANDKDTAVQELVLSQRARLLKAGLPSEVVDNMSLYLYQRLWS